MIYRKIARIRPWALRLRLVNFAGLAHLRVFASWLVIVPMGGFAQKEFVHAWIRPWAEWTYRYFIYLLLLMMQIKPLKTNKKFCLFSYHFATSCLRSITCLLSLFPPLVFFASLSLTFFDWSLHANSNEERVSVDGLPYVSDNASIYNSTRVYGPGRNRELLLCKYYILTRALLLCKTWDFRFFGGGRIREYGRIRAILRYIYYVTMMDKRQIAYGNISVKLITQFYGISVLC